MILGLFLGCAAPSDRDHYLAAVKTEGSTAEARRHCEAIHRADLRGECIAESAAAAAANGGAEATERSCEAIDQGPWRDECWFLGADTLGLIGDPAISWCGRAGRYRGNCLGHAIAREVKSTESRLDAVGQEPALLAAVSAIVDRYKPAAPESQRRRSAEAMTASIISTRLEEQPLSAHRCGQASEAICGQAYRFALEAQLKARNPEGVCSAPIALDSVMAAGFTGWAPAAAPLAMSQWELLCADLRNRESRMGAPPHAPSADGALRWP